MTETEKSCRRVRFQGSTSSCGSRLAEYRDRGSIEQFAEERVGLHFFSRLAERTQEVSAVFG